MSIYYFLPVILIAAGIAYTILAQKKARQAFAEGKGPQMFHDAYAAQFDKLLPDEMIIGMWQGQAYIKPNETAGQIAGNIAKQAALGMVGVSTYTPAIYVAVTTHGRVLVSEEYTDMGRRGNYKVVAEFPPGAQVFSGAAAYDHKGSTPTNPFNMGAPLELVRLSSGDEQYLGWVTTQGHLTGASSMMSITQLLPITAERASGIWQTASQPQAVAAAPAA